MTAIDLTATFAYLMLMRMPDSPRSPESLTVDELARLLALSRFSRRAIKVRMHQMGLASTSAAVDALLSRIASHPHTRQINELAHTIESAKRDAPSPTHQPDPST